MSDPPPQDPSPSPSEDPPPAPLEDPPPSPPADPPEDPPLAPPEDPPSSPPEDPPPAPPEDPPPSPLADPPEDPPPGPPEDPPPAPPEDAPPSPPVDSPSSPPENPPRSPPEDPPPSPPADPPLASTPPSSSSTPSPERLSLPGSPTPPLRSNSGGGGVSSGLVVGLVIGGLAIIVVVSFLFWCWCKKRKQRNDHEAGYYTPPSPHAPKVDPYASRQNAPHPESHVIVTQSPVFTYGELVRATDDFSDANLLGQGGFGYVYKGVLPNGKEVAVKQLKAESRQGEREFQAEVEIISRLHHKHLVSLVGYSISGSQKLLVYEFVPNNTLWFHLHGKKDRPAMDWPTRLKIALGSAKGLSYLHEDCYPKIIHRDIKTTNILLDFKFEAKVADFGLAKFFPDANTHISTRVMGTFGYMAPEYASTGKLTEKSDVFSFGVILLELITGHPPIPSTNTSMEQSLVDWVRPLLNGAIEGGNLDILVDPKLQNEYNHNEMTCMVACAAACVRHSPHRRPRMSQIVRTFEGDISVSDLDEGIRPGQSSGYHYYESSDYYYIQYKEDFRKMALSSQGNGTSSEASEYGLNPSGSSIEGQNTREREMKMMKKHSQGFSGSS